MEEHTEQRGRTTSRESIKYICLFFHSYALVRLKNVSILFNEDKSPKEGSTVYVQEQIHYLKKMRNTSRRRPLDLVIWFSPSMSLGRTLAVHTFDEHPNYRGI